VRAFAAVAATRPDVALVIAGADGWGADAFHRVLEDCPVAGRVVQLGYVPDDDLARWLAGAVALAFPSLYEGFGFPPVEAMAAGVPVVATAAGAVPEVVGEAALLVAPGDTDALSGALERVLDDEYLRARLVADGRCRATQFTWEACGAGLARLYADAAGGRR
jgi:glycosyltransferase involved in cell wall biosynthesis